MADEALQVRESGGCNGSIRRCEAGISPMVDILDLMLKRMEL